MLSPNQVKWSCVLAAIFCVLVVISIVGRTEYRISPSVSTRSYDYRAEIGATFRLHNNSRHAHCTNTNITKSATKVLIFTYYRSGSSFFGELFQQNHKFVYLFEPLRLLHVDERVSSNFMIKNLPKILDDCFNCKLTSVYHLSKYLNPSEEHFDETTYRSFWWGILKRFSNTLGIRNKDIIKGRQPIDSSLVQEMDTQCRKFDHRAIKIIKGGVLKNVAEVLDSADSSRTKVIYLVRDPRGQISSILKIEQQKEAIPDVSKYFKLHRKEILNKAKYICSNHAQNLLYLHKRMMSCTAGSVRMVRYEDVARAPLDKARKLYGFVGHELPDSVRTWIGENTAEASSSPKTFSTQGRNSSRTASAWKTHLTFDLARAVEDACTIVLETLGYRRIKGRREFEDLDATHVGDMQILQELVI